MKYEDLRELLKRIEFNKTEPEVFLKLIESAQVKGVSGPQRYDI